MTWTNGKHPYHGKYNDRSKRQRSKIIKGIKRVASKKHFLFIEWENDCEYILPFDNYQSEEMCCNCRRFNCYKNNIPNKLKFKLLKKTV